MSGAVAHRGPDGDGVFEDREACIGLAHRRLAVIDLSSAGYQPMTDEIGRAVVTYNGEIYNIRELRHELTAAGYRFRGHSDTEVLLKLYLHHGTEMLARLNGIFGFAIWDVGRRELFLARDALGVKPLYYTTTALGFIFASEIKALLCEDSVSRTLNPAAVGRHLTFLWSPAPETILRDVEKLEPGAAMLVVNGEVRRHWRYYDLPFGGPKANLPVAAACEALRQTLDRAVERQMVADVPVGAFLSGGLDSSAVVASARKFTHERLQCFTIAFEDTAAMAEEGLTEDLPYAKRVASHLGVDLKTILVGPDMIRHLEDMIYHLDEPQADPAALNAYFIATLARENGIKVLLSGAGGDDIFTGYRRHYALQMERLWAWLPPGARSAIGMAAGHLPTGPVSTRRLRKAFEHAGLHDHARIVSYFYWLDPVLARDLLAPDFRSGLTGDSIVDPLTSALDALPSGASKLDRMLHLDSRFFLSDHNLNYTDRMTMAHGVEARCRNNYN